MHGQMFFSSSAMRWYPCSSGDQLWVCPRCQRQQSHWFLLWPQWWGGWGEEWRLSLVSYHSDWISLVSCHGNSPSVWVESALCTDSMVVIYISTCTVEPLYKDTPLIRTLLWVPAVIIKKKLPLKNVDMLLIRTLSAVPEGVRNRDIPM